jgi:hypothetical protein
MNATMTVAEAAGSPTQLITTMDGMLRLKERLLAEPRSSR